MPTPEQVRWMKLIDLLNSDEFDYPSSWFEDSDGNRSLTMANRTPAAQYIPTDAQRMRIDGENWVRGDEWIYENIQGIHQKLRENPEYSVEIVDGTLYVKLAQ